MDLTDRIIAFEQGDLDEQDMFDLFQELVNNGMAWTLQGSYGRMAQSLLDAGYITYPVRRGKAFAPFHLRRTA